MANGVRKYVATINRLAARLNQASKNAAKPVQVNSGRMHQIHVLVSEILDGQEGPDHRNATGLEGLLNTLEACKQITLKCQMSPNYPHQKRAKLARKQAGQP